MVVLRRHLDRTRLKLMLGGALLVGCVVLAVSPGRLLLTERLHKREVLNAPFRKLYPAMNPILSQADFVVAGDWWLAGNLRLWFPNKPVLTPEKLDSRDLTGQRGVLVWEA